MNQFDTAIIFGGSGFVGTHLVNHLLKAEPDTKLIVYDLIEPENKHPNVEYIRGDLRSPIEIEHFSSHHLNRAQVIIYNLAAICRIPGSPDKDYFETNINEAETVTQFAESVGCEDIVYTSSMSVYGTSESEKTEETLLMPDNPYGISKAIGEQIHLRWFENSTGRNLHILRPGIIFGKGENANFHRLYKAISRMYFVYPGRKDTLKAAIYVKDVATVCHHFATNEAGYNLYNIVYPQPHTIKFISVNIAKITGSPRPILVIPAWLLISVSRFFQLFALLLGKKDLGLHPDRVRKLMVSTNVSGKKLEEFGIKMKYSLEDAIIDWYEDSGRQGLL